MLCLKNKKIYLRKSNFERERERERERAGKRCFRLSWNSEFVEYKSGCAVCVGTGRRLIGNHMQVYSRIFTTCSLYVQICSNVIIAINHKNSEKFWYSFNAINLCQRKTTRNKIKESFSLSIKNWVLVRAV